MIHRKSRKTAGHIRHRCWMAPLLGIVAASGIAACGGLPKEIVEEATNHSGEFVVGPEDVLAVTVWRNEDLSREVVVRPDGKISMPLIGDVQASGLTAEALARRLEVQFHKFKEDAKVSVGVKEVNSYNVFVLGEVTNPGKYQAKSYTTVLQAITLAGGFTLYASKNKIQVVRNVANGEGKPHEIRIPVVYDDLVSGEGELGNFFLRPGDTIVVP